MAEVRLGGRPFVIADVDANAELADLSNPVGPEPVVVCDGAVAAEEGGWSLVSDTGSPLV